MGIVLVTTYTRILAYEGTLMDRIIIAFFLRRTTNILFDSLHSFKH